MTEEEFVEIAQDGLAVIDCLNARELRSFQALLVDMVI